MESDEGKPDDKSSSPQVLYNTKFNDSCVAGEQRPYWFMIEQLWSWLKRLLFLDLINHKYDLILFPREAAALAK